MERIFPIVVACLLLIPVLWAVRIRIGLSYVGMVIAIAMSFLLTILVFLAKSLFLLWQSALIFLLLGLCITYFLQAKLSHRLFISQKEESSISTDEEKQLDEPLIEKDSDKHTDALEKRFEQPTVGEQEDQVDIRDWEELFRQDNEELKGGDIR